MDRKIDPVGAMNTIGVCILSTVLAHWFPWEVGAFLLAAIASNTAKS